MDIHNALSSAAPSTNGHYSHTAPITSEPPADWRERALNASLHGFHYGENVDALLQAIRAHRPGAATLLVEPSRQRLLTFLRTRAANFRELATPTESYDQDASNQTHPYLGWYGAEWDGVPMEVALAPCYSAGDAVCLADDADALRAFGHALEEFCARPVGRCLRYSEGWESAADLDAELGRVTWDDLVLPPDLLGRIREAVEGWVANRDAYHAMGFSWRRGVLLVGPPGTGKTMIGRAAAAALPAEMSLLYVRDLREHEKKEAIRSIFRRARQVAPCLLLLEDLDGLISDENRSVFLNEMDGFASNEGVLVIASSNHPHKIDEALLKRPSRFDRVFHVGLPAAAERAEFCRRTLLRGTLAGRLSPDLDVEALAGRLAAKTEGFTPAYLKEALIAAALQRAQDAGATVLDAAYAEAVLAQADELKKSLKKLKDPAVLAEMTAGEGTIGLRR